MTLVTSHHRFPNINPIFRIPSIRLAWPGIMNALLRTRCRMATASQVADIDSIYPVNKYNKCLAKYPKFNPYDLIHLSFWNIKIRSERRKNQFVSRLLNLLIRLSYAHTTTLQIMFSFGFKRTLRSPGVVHRRILFPTL